MLLPYTSDETVVLAEREPDRLWAFYALERRKHQLGDAFVLKDFHDEFIARGRIPISLIRYEMTGYDKDVMAFWNRRPLSSVISD